MTWRTRAKQLKLWVGGKRPVGETIQLNLLANEIEDLQQEYWLLNQLDELALAYLKYAVDDLPK